MKSHWASGAGTPGTLGGVVGDGVGAGVAVGPPHLFREELAEGRLFQPFSQVVDSGKAWWFVCPPTSASRPKIRAFEEWLMEELGTVPSAKAKRRA